MKVRTQHCGVGFLPPFLFGFRISIANSGGQAWQQVTLPAETFYWPKPLFFIKRQPMELYHHLHACVHARFDIKTGKCGRLLQPSTAGRGVSLCWNLVLASQLAPKHTHSQAELIWCGLSAMPWTNLAFLSCSGLYRGCFPVCCLLTLLDVYSCSDKPVAGRKNS